MFVFFLKNHFLFLYNSNLKKTLPNNITFKFCMPYHWNSVGHEAFQYLFETIMGCLVPFTLINTCYSSVICRLQSARFHRKSQGSCLILMIICTFAVFWLPYHIVNLIQVWFQASYGPVQFTLDMNWTAMLHDLLSLGSKATGDLPIQRCYKCIPQQLQMGYKGLKWATDSVKCSLVVMLSHAQTSIFIQVNTNILQFIWQFSYFFKSNILEKGHNGFKGIGRSWSDWPEIALTQWHHHWSRPGLSVLHTQGGGRPYLFYLFCILLVITSFPCSPPLTFLFILLQVTGLLQDKASVISAAKTARPNVTAFAYFSSAANPILYVFAGSSHIRQAGLSFMGKLFEGTYSESRTTSTRSGRMSSSSKENTVLQSLSVKLGKPFKGKNKNMSSVVGQNEPELKTLASVEPLD